MTEKSFGITEINLIGDSVTPTIESPNNLDIKAINVAISTDLSVGHEISTKNISGIGASFSGILTASSYVGSGTNFTGLTGASAGTYGNPNSIPQIIVDSNGRITSIANVLASGGGGGGGSGTEIIVKDNNSLVGTAGTINFGTNLSVSPVSAGVVTVTASGASAGVNTSGTSTFTDIIISKGMTVGGIATFNSAIDANGGASVDNIQIGVTGDNEIDTSSGNLTIDSAGGTTTIDDALTVTGDSTFNDSVEIGETLSHVGDSDTKISFPSADTIRFTTGNNIKLDLGSDGVTSHDKLVPNADDEFSLGSGGGSPKRWSEVHAVEYYGDGSNLSGIGTQNIDVQAQGLTVAGITTFHDDVRITGGGINAVGVITATSFSGDGSGLTGVTASGTGVVIKNDGSSVGTAGTINFGDRLNVSAISGGSVTITGIANTFNTESNQILVAGASTFTNFVDINSVLDVSGISTFGSDVLVNGSLQLPKLDITGGLKAVGVSTFENNVFIDGFLDVPKLDITGGLRAVGVSTFENNLNVSKMLTSTDITSIGGNFTGVVTATSFSGDGSNLTGLVAASGIQIKDGGSVVGTAGTIDFGANLSVSALSGAAVTITSGVSTAHVSTFDLVVAGVSTFHGVSNFKTNTIIDGTTTLNGSTTISGTNVFNIGNGNAQLYRDSNDLRVDVYGGNDMFLRTNVGGGTGAKIHLQPKPDEEGVIVNGDGAVELFHNNVGIVTTTSTGLNVSGIITASTFSGSASDLTGITPSYIINVKDYGATGDGSTRDDQAIQLAFNAANATSGQKGKKVIFPAGIYCVEAQLNITLDDFQEQFHVEGDGNVIIKQKHTNNGFNIDINTNGHLESLKAPRVTVRGIKFAHDGDSISNGQGKAIYLDGSNVAGRHTGMTVIEDCFFGSFSDQQKSFSMGVHVNELHEVSFHNCSFFMDFGNSQSPPADSLNTGVYIDASSSSQPAHYFFNACTFLYGNAGIMIKEYVEGLYVVNCGFVALDNGIICDSDATGNEPGLQVSNCHFNTGNQENGFGISCYGMVDIQIDNSLFYIGDNTLTTTGTRSCIMIQEGARYTINNNIFNRIGPDLSVGQNVVGVIIRQPPSSGHKIGSIQNNVFTSFSSQKRAVWLESTSQQSVVANNLFSNCSLDVLNEGTGNVVSNNHSFTA